MNIVPPGKLEVGMFVTVLDMDESTGWQDSVQPNPLAAIVGIPFEVKAVCLPFIIGVVQRPVSLSMLMMGSGGIASLPIDTRKVQLMEVPREFYNVYTGRAETEQK